MPSAPYPWNSSPPTEKARAPYPPPEKPMASAIQLAGPIAPESELTLVSARITVPFRILQFSVHFPSGCDALLLAYPLLSFDDHSSTSGVPLGTNLLSPGSPTEYLVGDTITITVPTGRIVIERGAYLKIHFDNQDGYTHRPIAIFTIQEYLPPEH